MARIAGKSGNIYIASQLIEDCEDAWNEQVIGDVTSTLDNSDYRVGAGSAKLAVAAGFATGVIGSEAIGALDLRNYTHLMAWAKSSVALAAADYQLLLDDTALCASPLETLDIPALTPSAWRLIFVALATPANLSAVISVGAKCAVDKGALDLHIDEVRAAKQIGGIKSWTVEYEVQVLETTGFDSSGVRSYIAGISGWRGSFEGYKDGVPLTIGSVVHLELAESATGTQSFTGSVVITNLRAITAHDQVIGYSYDFQGLHELEIPTA